MNRIFRVAKEKKMEIKNYYMAYGCKEREAELYSSNVFNCGLVADESVPYSDAWEIECQSPITTKIKTVKSKNMIYASWLKNGWSKSGFWEKTDIIKEGSDKKKNVPFCPRSGCSDTNGNSYFYWKYIKKNNRSIEVENLNPQDFVFTEKDEMENKPMMKKLPLTVAAYKKQDYLHIAAKVKTDGHKEQKKNAINHVFAVDVSGSMGCRLILVQLSMVALFNSLDKNDTVTVLTYSENCQLVDEYIPVSDKERFQKAIFSVEITGGFGRTSQVLQIAYTILNRHGQNGVITLFTDSVPNSGLGTQAVQNAYVNRQLLFGNKMNAFVYGSDTWADKKLNSIIRCAGGRIIAVFEPENIVRAIDENISNFGEFIYDVNFMPEMANELHLLGEVSPTNKMIEFVEMTEGSLLKVTFCGFETFDLDCININFSWKDASGQQCGETIAVTVEAAPEELADKINTADNLDQLKIEG